MKKINTQRYSYNFSMAIDAVLANKFRSFLTALGIIFGVGAVIAMLSIGKGAKKELIDQMKYIGVNNIIITPKTDVDASQTEGDKSMTKKFSRGLTIMDAESIEQYIPTVTMVSSEVNYDVPIVYNGLSMNATLSGVDRSYFEIFNITIDEGHIFSEAQLHNGSPVCVIGGNIKSKLFTDADPIGKYIKCGGVNLKIIGVMEKSLQSASMTQDFGLTNYNNCIFTPIQTIMLRYKDRTAISSTSFSTGETTIVANNAVIQTTSSQSETFSSNQIDKIIVHIGNTEDISASTEILHRMMLRRHSDIEDFSIVVPDQLLKQEQRTKDIFNIVLGAIASISLIVGGIGIMNIMLASVMERTKEIGTRLAIGAKKSDIIFQFLSEATVISLIGGIIGIILGVVLSKLITTITGILTIVSFSSIIISFGVSATIGIIFGYMPAKKAAYQNPVESLRYE